jgi:hypothetical protein
LIRHAREVNAIKGTSPLFGYNPLEIEKLSISPAAERLRLRQLPQAYAELWRGKFLDLLRER